MKAILLNIISESLGSSLLILLWCRRHPSVWKIVFVQNYKNDSIQKCYSSSTSRTCTMYQKTRKLILKSSLFPMNSKACPWSRYRTYLNVSLLNLTKKPNVTETPFGKYNTDRWAQVRCTRFVYSGQISEPMERRTGRK